MTRAQERHLKLLLRRATVPALTLSLARPQPKGDGPEEEMDRLWSDKAALGELLRRGFFNGDQR